MSLPPGPRGCVGFVRNMPSAPEGPLCVPDKEKVVIARGFLTH